MRFLVSFDFYKSTYKPTNTRNKTRTKCENGRRSTVPMAPMGAAPFSHRLAACHHTASLISHLLHNIRNTRMHLCSCCNMNSAHEMPGDESTRCSYQLLFVKSLSQYFLTQIGVMSIHPHRSFRLSPLSFPFSPGCQFNLRVLIDRRLASLEM